MAPNSQNFVEEPVAETPLFTKEHLEFLNERLSNLTPLQIIEWATITIPNLYQTTAFGLSGLVILDMISKVSLDRAEKNGTQPQHLVPLIFLDTLYHFPETVELAHRAAAHYNAPLKVYKPVGCSTAEDLERMHGQKLWETDGDIYDYLVKVEPAQRAILEIERGTGLVKLNPLAHWDYQRVWTYIRANEVPYNPLIDQGYRSIGDWHSTKPVSNTANERAGRWEGQAKTECGLHKDYFEMRAAFLAARERRTGPLARQVTV
ncbi:6277_t:CDS:2 [Paraglomus occultum]|uniref:6277_t:CDS:1 n=1 Tax=Paraglomus occultum TaxID=144539 RepID=A0A9N9AE42_9GLOM|nr:6277_t:CDS:2 [Paraglomus occultum]